MQQTAEEIRNDMIEMFGDNLPNIENEPLRFTYYLKLYFYERSLNEQRTSENQSQ